MKTNRKVQEKMLERSLLLPAQSVAIQHDIHKPMIAVVSSPADKQELASGSQ